MRRRHGVLHLHRLEHEHGLARASTSAPFSTATLTTVPGIGASRLPLATASAGSVNRGLPRQARVAGRAVHVDLVAGIVTSYVVRTPSVSSVTLVDRRSRVDDR